MHKPPAPANNDTVPRRQGPTAQKLWSDPDSPRSVRPLTELGGAGWVGRIEQAKQANQAGQGANQARHDASATPAMASTAICEANDTVPHRQGPTAQKLWSEPDSPRSVRPLTELGGAGWVGRIEQAKQANQAGQGASQARHDASATPAMASTCSAKLEMLAC